MTWIANDHNLWKERVSFEKTVVRKHQSGQQSQNVELNSPDNSPQKQSNGLYFLSI